MPNTLRTTDEVVIEEWAKKRDGVPAKVEGTNDLLRIKFDPLSDKLQDLTWAEFFDIFQKNNLEFIYTNEEDSRFYKFTSKN